MKHRFIIGFLTIILTAGICLSPCRSDAMKLVPTHPLLKVLRNWSPEAPVANELRLDGAPGETVSGQVVLIPGDSKDTVTAKVPADLRSGDGMLSIPSNAIRLQWVRYMEISKNTQDIPVDELVAAAPVSIPDPFYEDEERPVEHDKHQPLWVEIGIPADARPGDYRGELTVTGRSGRAIIPMSVRVRSFQLQETRHQRVIQWWDVPGRGFENLKPGTDEYWKHLERMCAMVHRHRQTDVRVSWDLVERKTDSDGKPYWDTSLFEKFADTAFKSGLKAVQFTALGRHTASQLQPDCRTEGVEDNMGRLTAVQEVVARRKWQGRVLTSLADEPFIYQEKTYRELLDRVRKAAPDVGVIEAIESEDLGQLDIYVPKLTHIDLWWPHFDELKRRGEDVWFYTCCHPTGRYPNRFLDQPLVKARELHWISYLYGLDGYLHWGFNWFTADGDPYSEKGANPWSLPPGDSQVAYPGKDGFIGSMRLSVMRDGLQDYEYLWTLENRLRALKSRTGEDASWLDPKQRPLELCRRVVQSFYDHTRDPKVLLDTRKEIADEIEALDATPLLYVQTSPPEGSITPGGPIMINVRGVTAPGAKVTINDQPVIPENISSSGCFVGFVFINLKNPEIVVTAELDGVKRTAKRVFRVIE